MDTLLSGGEVPVDGFLCPGHVSVVIGSEAYEPIASRHGCPCVVAGFDAPGILAGIAHLARQVVDGEARVTNLYPQVVRSGGNPHALALLDRVFAPADVAWRALGTIPESGLDLRPEFADHDAFRRYDVTLGEDRDPPGCRCGEVITGRLLPNECELFGGACTPRAPVGPCMVSSEGTCQAWFKYGRK